MAECKNGCGNELQTYCFACDGRLREDSEALKQELREAREEIRRLEDLAYIGEHHFPDLTYKARFEELLVKLQSAKVGLELISRIYSHSNGDFMEIAGAMFDEVRNLQHSISLN